MDAFIGTILPVGFNFAPRGWLSCNGQILPIAQNSALFAVLGTMYGGDGQSSFGIPDLRGRVAVGAQAQGPGLQNIIQGEKGGTNNATVIANGTVSFTLGVNNLPQHNHAVAVPGSAFTAQSKLFATSNSGTPPASYTPAIGTMLGNSAGTSSGSASIYNPAGPTVEMAAASVTTTLVGNANVTSGNTGTGNAVTAPVVTNATISNMQPYLGLNYIIATEGIFPTRN